MIGRMFERKGYPRNDLGRRCLDEIESMQHLLCDYPALQRYRFQYLCKAIFPDLECLNEIMLFSLLRYDATIFQIFSSNPTF